MSFAVLLGQGEGETPNLIRNGSFSGPFDRASWNKGDAYMTPSYADGVSRSPSGGCLALDVIDTGRRFQYYREAGFAAIPLHGLTEIDAVAYAKSGADAATVSIYLDFRSDARFVAASLGHNDGWQNDIAVTGSSWVEVGERNITVPEGATHVAIAITPVVAGGTATIHVDDIYVGPPGEENDPYPSAAVKPLAANRFMYGAFESDITYWNSVEGTETLSQDTTTPISGTGSLKCVCPGESTFEGVRNNPFQMPTEMPVVPGETLRISFKFKGASDFECSLTFVGAASPNVVVWAGTTTNGIVTYTQDFVVPAGAYSITNVYFWTADADPAPVVTFLVDDISIGTPQA